MLLPDAHAHGRCADRAPEPRGPGWRLLWRIAPLLLCICLLSACSSKSNGPAAPNDIGAGSNSVGTSAKAGASNAPELPGKLLETGESTLDLVVAGKRTPILHAPANNSYFEYPVFSPDGTKVAYVLATTPTAQGQDWGNDIYTANLDGSNAKLVLKHDHIGVLVDALSWTPDGSALIFAYYLTQYDAQGHYTGQITRIERLDLASGSTTTVLNNAFQPSISWDGKQLVYVDFPQSDFQTPSLAVANIDGSQSHKILRGQQGFQTFFAPHLSPDGTQVVFAAVGGPVGLAPGSGGSSPTPTPAGRRIPSPADAVQAALAPLRAWLRPPSALADGSPYQVWVANVDGSNLHALGNLREDLPYPLWSADGKSILFLGAGGLYTAAASGGNPSRIGAGVAHGEIAWYQK
jgi:Tol biopolymer transport system component